MRKLTEKLSFLQKCPFGAETKTLSLHSASKQSFRKVLAFVGSCRPHWQFLSCEKKGTKDSQGTSWFLDLQQKGALPPLDTPSGESSFARFSGAMTAKVISAETKTLPCPLRSPPMMLEASVINEGERHGVTVETGQCYKWWKNKVLRHCSSYPSLRRRRTVSSFKLARGWAA